MKPKPKTALAIIGLLLLPVVLLWPCLFGDRVFVPWDIAQFPPAMTLMTDAEYQDVIRNNNTDVTEIPVMFIPEWRFIKSELEKGRFPGWNPYSRSGTPIWSSSILGVWYPLNWIILVPDDPASALAIVGFLSIAVATLLMFGFLSHLGVGLSAAILGAIAFGLSGTLTVNLHFYQRINALIWLPGILWAISAIHRRAGPERLPAMIGLALCMFMTHTAGFPPFAIAVTLIAVVFAIRVLVLEAIGRGPKAAMTLGGAIAAGAGIGLLTAAVQWLPMFAWVDESNRQIDVSGNLLATGGYDPAGLLGYLCPTVYTHPHLNQENVLQDKFSPLFWYLYSRASWVDAGAIPAGTTFEPNLNFCEYTLFVGTLTLFLATAGVFAKKVPMRLFAPAMVVGLFLLASASPWVESLLAKPPISWVPPTRYTGPTCMFVALLAGLGLHSLKDMRPFVRRFLWIVGAGLGSTFLALSYWVSTKTPEQLLDTLIPGLRDKYGVRFPEATPEEFAARAREHLGGNVPRAQEQLIDNLWTSGLALLFCALLFFLLPRLLKLRHGRLGVQVLAIAMLVMELLSFGIPLNTGRVLHDRPLNTTTIHEYLRGRRDELQSTGGFSVLRAHDDLGGKRPAIMPTQLPPDTLLNEHIRDQQIYTFVDRLSHLPILAMYGPSQLARQTWPLSIRDDELLERPYWDMIGVRFVLSENQLKHAGSQVASLSGPRGAEKPTKFFYVYERPHPRPRAWVVHDYKSFADQKALVQGLIHPDFRPERYVLLEDDVAAALTGPVRRDLPADTRKVTFPVPMETNALTLEVSPGEAGYLVVDDTYMSGWRVEIDGEEVPIQQANLFQRTVQLPNKSNAVTIVHFQYSVPGFPLGLSLSVLCFLLLLGVPTYRVISRRRRRSVEDPL